VTVPLAFLLATLFIANVYLTVALAVGHKRGIVNDSVSVTFGVIVVSAHHTHLPQPLRAQMASLHDFQEVMID